ncbi:MAG TPA: XdhC/CoxI family protein [Opitutaceae bacterium]|nr:XdhC/CoxI family protein [Opitutaceae bacterium]
MKELRSIYEFRLSHPTEPAVLATLVSVVGSSYRRPGARMLITAKGLRVGSISGGCLEEDVIVRAQRVLATGTPETITYDTSPENDLVWGVGLGCHGIVDVLVEKLPSSLAPWESALEEVLQQRATIHLEVTFHASNPNSMGTRLIASSTSPASDPSDKVFAQVLEPPIPLVIFGAGDDAQPLARFAAELGWSVTVADPRPAFATRTRFAQAAHVLVLRHKDSGFDLNSLPLSPRTLAVVMTHHYVHDKPLLGALLQRPLAYLGLLGPKKRAERILSDLVADGLLIAPEIRATLHAPVGLDLGAETPEEVALAILSEMQACLAKRDPISLSRREKPIHSDR